ncbi:ComEC/Rec2-related domain protein [uncultured delta proteobacterium]|uniref:ComEC/Rec2-related domain protein n=1 Tax=uncultured delta proteobacterium TaxID=34034 RepID=A0A212K1T8_9DELT|nr:ComEC/Rec2-related domain protein [uncultured delta proteobacterium]
MANTFTPPEAPSCLRFSRGPAACRETAAPRRASPYSPLLFRQVCLLAALAGMLACRFPGHGLLACALLALLTLSFADYRKIALFAAFFCFGFVFAFARMPAFPAAPAVPEWVRTAVTPEVPSGGGETDGPFETGLPLAGIVAENDALAGNRSRLLLENVRTPGQEAPLPGKLVLTWQNPPPDIAGAGPGQRLAATVRIREIRGFANPGVWETESYWRDRGAFFRAWSRDDGTRNGKTPPYVLEGEASALWRLRGALQEATLAALAGKNGNARDISQAGAVIPALLFGDRSYLAPETLDLVARSTLAHSLALSGMHLGFAAGIGYAAAYFLSFLFPSLFLRLPRQKAGLLCALPLCLCYLWIGGAPPSLLRAALMLLFWGALLWMNRPKVLIDGLLWAVALIVLVSPAALFDIRLQLSAVSVAGIGLAAPLLAALAGRPRGRAPGSAGSRLGSGLRRLVSVVLGMAAVSVAAQAAVLPLVLDAFPGTGLWFPLNLVWLPVLGMWVMPLAFAGLFMTALGLPAAASLLFSLAQGPCAGLLSLLGAMDAAGILVSPVALRPAFPAAAGYWLLLLLLPAVAPARAFSRRALLLLCLGLGLAAGPSLYPMLAGRRDSVQLTLIDVGQGQSVAVSWRSEGARGRLLLDGGGFASPFFDTGRQVVSPVLTDNKAPRLDWIVNSHPDTDHLQGLLFPMDAFMLGRVASGQNLGQDMGQDPESAAKPTLAVRRRDAILRRRGITPEVWQAGDVITLAPDLSLQVLHPAPDGQALSSNDSALVLRLVWRGKPLALICGDLERKGINALLQRKSPLEADVLVLPHHGSAGSFAPQLYDDVAPRLALAACGYANAWNFPARKVRDALAVRAIPLATTAANGQIAVTWDETLAMQTRFARE